MIYVMIKDFTLNPDDIFRICTRIVGLNHKLVILVLKAVVHWFRVHIVHVESTNLLANRIIFAITTVGYMITTLYRVLFKS